MTAPVVHLITQRDHPFGGQRRCCERCGAAGPPINDRLLYATDAENYRAYGYFRCDKLSVELPTPEAARSVCCALARLGLPA